MFPRPPSATCRVPGRFFCAGLLLLCLTGRAATAFFDFNSDPTASGLLTLYGSATWVPGGGVGAATNANDGFLQVTPSSSNQRGAVVFADFDNGKVIEAFTFDAAVRIGNGSAAPADGFSINYVRGNDPVLSDVAGGGNPAVDANIWATGPNCEANLPEEGTQTGISIGFDAWDSGGAPPYCNEADQSIGPDIVGVDVRVDGNLVLQFPTPTLNGACNDPTSIQTGPTDNTGTADGLCWAHLKVVLDTNAVLNVYWKDTLILSNYQTSYVPSPGRLVFAGRTGGAWEFHQVDNINITTIAVPALPVALTNSPASGISTTSAILGGGILSSGVNLAGVTLFYGPSDGGTNAGSWANSVYLGPQGGGFQQRGNRPFIQHPLLFHRPGHQQRRHFLGQSLALVQDDGASAAHDNEPRRLRYHSQFGYAKWPGACNRRRPTQRHAFLRAGGWRRTPSAWSNNLALGPQTGAFGQTVSGLVSNQTYFFTSEAVNGAGTAWATPSFSFRTPATNTPPPAGVAVLTYHNDNTRQGLNANEKNLTLANVNSEQLWAVILVCRGWFYLCPAVDHDQREHSGQRNSQCGLCRHGT